MWEPLPMGGPMSTPVRIVVYGFVGVLMILAVSRSVAGRRSVAPLHDGGATYRLDRAGAARAGARFLDQATRARTFRFAPGSTPADEQAFLAAIAVARPEARRLIDDVDGLVTVAFGTTGIAGVIGLTHFDGTHYEVTIDIADIAGHYGGVRGVDATILHEMGHVVDRALVPDDLIAALNAQIPTGERCLPGQPTGACAPVAERFADTFAKWAMNDLGVNGTVGYRILPPVPISVWGEPLARLGA
jgi:hypothetical protein